MSVNLKIWDALKQPPPSVLKEIKAGRMSGKHDINPQWRYKAMTELFGVCGIGWKYEIVRIWTESAFENQVFAFAEVRVYIKQDDKWSEPIPATGGSMLVNKESKGLYANDEAYKMATTDALGTAMKMLGVAADVYMGLYDGSKYKNNQSAGGNPLPPSPLSSNKAPSPEPPLTSFGKFLKAMEEEKKRIGEKDYYTILGNNGVEHCNEIKDRKAQVKVYGEMEKITSL